MGRMWFTSMRHVWKILQHQEGWRMKLSFKNWLFKNKYSYELYELLVAEFCEYQMEEEEWFSSLVNGAHGVVQDPTDAAARGGEILCPLNK